MKNKSELIRATDELAAWRKRAAAGVAAISAMNEAVARMDAATKVNAILNGRKP